MSASPDRIPAELPGHRQIGWVNAFRVPGLVEPQRIARLKGLDVGLRWACGSVSAVVFASEAEARHWPTFTPMG